jgi:hypothetical protein
MLKNNFIKKSAKRGQALVEYVLLVAVIMFAFFAVIAITGPAVGNVFSNVVFNLVGITATPRAIDPAVFWLTVEAAASRTPQEIGFVPNTLPPPTSTPTAGPSPSPTPVTPTLTFTNTPLPTFTPTATDRYFRAPWADDVQDGGLDGGGPISDTSAWWRTENTPLLGGPAIWTTNYWRTPSIGTGALSNGNGDGTATTHGGVNRPLYQLNFNYRANGGPGNVFDGDQNSLLPGIAGQWLSAPANVDGAGRPINYAVRMERTVTITAGQTLTFTVASDDGVRLWVYREGSETPSTCSAPALVRSNNQVYNSPSTHCLLIDDWVDQGMDAVSATRTFTAAGQYVIRIEHYQGAGDGGLAFNVQESQNVASTSSACAWGTSNPNSNTEVNRTNTPDYMFDEYIGGGTPDGATCVLELRGAIDIPAAITNPELTFFSVWDLRGSSSASAVVEVREYVPPTDPTYASAPWTATTLYTSGSANYNWTRISLPMNTYVGRSVAVRFRLVFGTGGTRRWYLDNIGMQQNTRRDYIVGNDWTLDTVAQKGDFIPSGRWDLSGEANRIQPPGAGMGWSDSPSNIGNASIGGGSVTYLDFDGQSNDYTNSSTSAQQLYRIHALEFNGWVDVRNVPGPNVPDDDGDTGAAMLSFYYSYDIGNRGWIEVQYTRDDFNVPNPTWTIVTSTDNTRSGNLLEFANSRRTAAAMSFREVILADIPNAASQKFRLRFALIVPNNYTSNDGMYIDDIKLERLNAPRYLPYPFSDTAEVSDAEWLMSGNWARFQTAGVFGSAWVYTDSPIGNYPANANTIMMTRGIFDLRNDTPTNPSSTTCNLLPAALCVGGGTAAIRPMMTFWWKRAIANNDSFSVQWKRISEPNIDSNWKTFWFYNYGGTTTNPAARARDATGTQLSWEYVEIDLRPVMLVADADTTAANRVDDDIQIRFSFNVTADGRIDVNNSSHTADGITLDDIRVFEYSETTWALWSGDPDGGGPLPAGNGNEYIDDVDTPVNWWDRWTTGGAWMGVDYTAAPRSGIRSFHDSLGPAASPQTSAPFYLSSSNTYNGVSYTHRTFNVLYMDRYIDLRGVQPANRPTLEFWHRYWVGEDDSLLLQLATEDNINFGSIVPPAASASPCNTGAAATAPTQCYERTANWSQWNELFRVGSVDNDMRLYTWKRERIDLTSFIGRRVRIRFVTDAFENGTNRDGWFVDNVRFFYNNYTSPPPYAIPFFDNARNLTRWVPEGLWGLDAERFRGAGGAPADFGVESWRAYWFSHNGNLSNLTSLLNSIPDTDAANTAAVITRQPPTPPNMPDATQVAAGGYNAFPRFPPQFLSDINFDFGTSGPRYANGTVWRTDNFMARFTRNITVLAGDYTFITITDDGVRMRYTPGPTTAGAPNANGGVSGACNGWNIICNWTWHGRTVDMSVITFPTNGNYRLTMEWFEGGSDALVVLSAGSNAFSFSDSPKLIVGPGPAVNSVSYGNSSLILRDVIDLCGANDPILNFYSTWDSPGSGMVIEASIDGGFNWSTDHSDTMADSAWWGWWTYLSPPNSDWDFREYYLGAYRGQYVMLRFRRELTNQTENGMWITDITINASSVTGSRNGAGLCVNAPGFNFVQAPSFDLGNSFVSGVSQLGPWIRNETGNSSGTPRVDIRPDLPRTGARAARLQLRSGQTNEIYQVVRGLAPNTTYTVTGWGFVTNTPNVQMTAGVRYNGSTVTRPSPNATKSVYDSSIAGDLVYRQFSFTFTTNATVTQAEIFCRSNSSFGGTGFGWCDDFSITAP